MKTKTLALLASLAVLTTVAQAARNATETEVVVLPTYNVEAPRYTPVEKQINASLDAMRQLARTPLAISVDCMSLKAVARDGSLVARQASDRKAARLAKS